MQNYCTTAIEEALKSEVVYGIYLNDQPDEVLSMYSLSHLNIIEIKSLSRSIIDALSRSKILAEPPNLGDEFENSDEYFETQQKFYHDVILVIVNVGMVKFEIDQNGALGIPYPIYELLAKRIFEALEDVDCLVDFRQWDSRELFKVLLSAGGESYD